MYMAVVETMQLGSLSEKRIPMLWGVSYFLSNFLLLLILPKICIENVF